MFYIKLFNDEKIITILALFLTFSVGYSDINAQQKENSNSKTLTVEEAKKFHTEQGKKIVLVHPPSSKSSINLSHIDYVIDWNSASYTLGDYKSDSHLSLNRSNRYMDSIMIAEVNGTIESAYFLIGGVMKLNITEDVNTGDLFEFFNKYVSIYKFVCNATIEETKQWHSIFKTLR